MTWRELYLAARKVGISPERFWRSTPRELELEYTAAKDRLESRRQEKRAMVWLQAGLMRAKKLPEFYKFTGITKETTSHKLDWRALQSMVRGLGRASTSDRAQGSQSRAETAPRALKG